MVSDKLKILSCSHGIDGILVSFYFAYTTNRNYTLIVVIKKYACSFTIGIQKTLLHIVTFTCYHQ